MLWAVPEDGGRRGANLRVVRGEPAEDDAELDALRRRDPAAVGALFERHARRVERLLLNVLGPDPDLPDLVQQAFLGALESLPSFRGDAASFVPWLNRVAVFTARKHVRRRRSPPHRNPRRSGGRPPGRASPGRRAASGRSRRSTSPCAGSAGSRSPPPPGSPRRSVRPSSRPPRGRPSCNPGACTSICAGCRSPVAAGSSRTSA
ncbi:MAG: hypothetical protein GYA57_15260 [Myxococcales bacterium]|nr:hypothetical protein [Myxococcales bacterium]